MKQYDKFLFDGLLLIFPASRDILCLCSEGKSFVGSDSLDKAQVEIPAPYPAIFVL